MILTEERHTGRLPWEWGSWRKSTSSLHPFVSQLLQHQQVLFALSLLALLYGNILFYPRKVYKLKKLHNILVKITITNIFNENDSYYCKKGISRRQKIKLKTKNNCKIIACRQKVSKIGSINLKASIAVLWFYKKQIISYLRYRSTV